MSVASVDEAKKHLDDLQRKGPTAFAFTFRGLYPPDEKHVPSIGRTAFEPCPAV